MLELPWHNDWRPAQSPSPTPEPEASAPPPQGTRKPADEQFRSVLRGATKTLVSEKGGMLRHALVLPCGHVCDQFEAEYGYKQKLAFEKRSAANPDRDRVAQLRASAAKAYVCMRCPADQRRDIVKKPTELPAETSINAFMDALRRDIPDAAIDRATAEQLEQLKIDLRGKPTTMPKLPKQAPVADIESAAYNCAVGESLARQGKMQEAQTWFHAAVTAVPDHRTYNRNMAVCLNKQNKKAEAEPYLKQAGIEAPGKTPQDAGRVAQPGYDLLTAKRYAEAAPLFKKAQELEPENPFWHSALGACASGQGKHAEARTYFEKALALQPDNSKSQRDVGYSLYMLGHYRSAHEHLLKAYTSEPHNARFTYELAWCTRKIGDVAKAEMLFKAAINKSNQDPHYCNDLGMYYFIQKRYTEAQDYFKMATSRSKELHFLENLAKCEQKLAKKAGSFIEKARAKVDRVRDKYSV